MANLSETPDYPAGVYQLETSDPVLGGPGGIANRQAEQLGNRTAWLKDKVDAFISGTVAVFKATKLATPRTLSISGAGSGSASFDGSANASIALTLADSGVVAGSHAKVTVNAQGLVTAGAPLAASDIPANLALTGAPSAPTAAMGSNTSQLANTAFVQAALAALVDSSPAALNTLNELALALGDDPNFAASMASALGLRAPLSSPAFTDNPTAPTPQRFDNDASLATTEFVKRSGLTYAAIESIVSSCAMAAADAGKVFAIGATATVTLPLASSLPQGTTFTFFYYNAALIPTFVRSGADLFATGGGALSTYTPKSTGYITFTNEAGGTWEMSGTATLDQLSGFSANLSSSGRQRLPSGEIEQWFPFTPTNTSENVLLFPIVFPNAVLGWSAGVAGSAGANVVRSGPISTSSIALSSSNTGQSHFIKVWGY